MGLGNLKRFLLVLALCAAISSLSVVSAGSIGATGGSEPLQVNGGFIPRQLSSRLASPIAVRVSGSVEGKSDSPLSKMFVWIDRNVSVDADAFPSCAKSRLMREASTQACSGAIVGVGRSEFALGSVGTGISRLAIVNGGDRAGELKLYLVLSNGRALAQQIVGEMTFEKVSRGRFGVRGLLQLYDREDGAALRKFSLAFNRIPRSGAVESVFHARCRNGYLSAEVSSYTFADGESIDGETFARTCVAKH